MPEQPPSRVGPYPIRGVIGSGAMGMVMLAHDPAIDRPVAIKTIHRRLLESPDDLDGQSAAARFRVEAKAAGRLMHRNIVSVHQFGEDMDCAYIVMEYVAGRNLRDYIQSPPRLGVAQVLCVMTQLLDGLHYAHERGIVHRDVKPANLLIADDGRLKITDFGIARTESSNLTRANSVVGSPGYIAPEQYTGADIDRRVDVFSAGVLLYQMLSGTMPFAGTDEAIMYKIVYEPHKPLADLMQDPAMAPFDAVLELALAKDPALRYENALAMRTALAALAGEPLADVLDAGIVLGPRISPAAASGIAPTVPDRASPGSIPSRPATTPSSGAGSWPLSQPSSGSSGSVPVPTGWDAAALTDIERELAQHVGAVAKVLVRRAARGLTSLAAIRQAVAASISDIDARQKFLAKAGARPTDSVASSSGFQPTLPADTHDKPIGAPMREGDIDKAAAALAHSLGPIAKLVAKRCGAKASTREQFVASVLEQLTPSIDPGRVQADLWRAFN